MKRLIIIALLIFSTFSFIEVAKYPEEYITTWRYQLEQDILNGDKQAIELYESVYVKNGKDLFKDDYAIRDTYK